MSFDPLSANINNNNTNHNNNNLNNNSNDNSNVTKPNPMTDIEQWFQSAIRNAIFNPPASLNEANQRWLSATSHLMEDLKFIRHEPSRILYKKQAMVNNSAILYEFLGDISSLNHVCANAGVYIKCMYPIDIHLRHIIYFLLFSPFML